MSDASSADRSSSPSWASVLIAGLRSLFAPAPAPTRPSAVVADPRPRDVLWHRLIRSYFDFRGQTPKDFIRDRLLAADPSVVEVLGIDQATGAYDSFSSTVIVRLSEGRFALLHKNDEHESGFVTESEITCAVHALGYATEAAFRETFEPIVAGPFDRSLEGWMDVAADWWEENGEDDAAAELRRIAESERQERAMAGMTFEERLAYLRSLRQ